MGIIKLSKPNALFLSKFQSRWECFIVNKFSHEFNVSILYLSDLIRLNGYKKTLSIVNQYITLNKINVVLIDVEFYPEIDFKFIRDISNSVVKVSLFFDDLLMHDFNSITAAYSDLILTADPISVLRYREKGFSAEYIALEADQSIFYERAGAKDIDVLFDGTMVKADRKEYINYLRANGVAVTVIEERNNFISFNELGSIISRTKVMINFSKTHHTLSSSIDVKSRPVEEYFSYLLQLKGRLIMSGLCKTACISEYAPALSLLFSEDEIPTFSTFKECLDLINLLLEDETRLAYHAEKLHSKVLAEYEDQAYLKKLLPKICKRGPFLFPLKPLPYWYMKRVAQARVRHLCSSPFRHIFELLILLWSKPNLVVTLHVEVIRFYFLYFYRRFFGKAAQKNSLAS